MHIECVKNNGKDYLRIAEARYIKELGKQKKFVVKNIGLLSKFDDGKPDFLKRLREQFKNGEIEFDGISYSSKTQPKNYFELDNQNNYIELKNIGSIVLEKIYNDLGINDVLFKAKSSSKIEYDLNGIIKMLVFNRILNPCSKKKAFENKNDYLFPLTICNDITEVYRSLSVISERSEAIQKRINTKIKQSSIGRNTDLTYYDVTNYYFEAMYPDDDVFLLDEKGNKVLDDKNKPIIIEKGFRKNGVGKDGKNQPLVAMGLFIDNNGLPVSFNTFPGNTQDKTTFKEMIKNSLNKQELGKVVVVADNGMNAQENMYLLVLESNGYIISKSVKKSWSKFKEWATDETGYDYTQKNNDITFKSKSRIYDRVLKDKEGHRVTIKEKEIIYWSKKQFEKEKYQNEKFIEYLESCKENPDKLKDKQRKSQEFIKVIQTDKKTGEVLKTKEVIVLLEDKIQKYKETMGFYSIVTSETELSDQEIINRYHGLSRIEDSFRIIKSDLEGRPIYLKNKDHINAHFLICFIALTIIRLLQYKVLKYQGESTLNVDGWKQGITAEKIKESINSFKACSDKNGICLFSKPTEDLKLLFDSLNIDYKLPRPTIDELNNLKVRINNSTLM